MFDAWRRGAFWMSGCLMAGCLALVGCDNLDFGRTGGPVGNEAQTAADAAADLDSPEQPGVQDPAPAATPAPMTPPASAEESGSHVGEQTKEVLNAQELASDPNWKVVASNPMEVKGFTVAGTAYNRAAALGGTANLEKWLKMRHALNDSYPTYQELIDYIAKNSFDMPALRVYQHYGYDESTGQIVILENQREKQKRRGDLGIE